MWWMTARAGALVLEPRAGRQIEGEEGREDGWGRRQGRPFSGLAHLLSRGAKCEGDIVTMLDEEVGRTHVRQIEEHCFLFK